LKAKLFQCDAQFARWLATTLAWLRLLLWVEKRMGKSVCNVG